MFILIPISHEDQVVQRMPWVTIVIIVLNVIIFLFTSMKTNKIGKVCDQKFNEILNYYFKHPDIDIKKFLQEEGIAVPVGYFEGDGETDEYDQGYAEEYDGEYDEEYDKEYDKEYGGSDHAAYDAKYGEGSEEEFSHLVEEFRKIKHSLPFYKYGLIPKNPKAFNYLSSLFMHGDFFHLFFNMLFLWLVGCNIEDRWGRPLFTGFYLISGLFATYAHVLMFPNSVLPLIGASGAIAGAMGAFMIKMYKTKIKIFYIFFFFLVRMGTFEVSTFVALPFWIAQQLYYALSNNSVNGGGVAFWAHIGGFAFGAAAAYIMSQLKVEEDYIQPNIDKKISFTQNPRIVSSLRYYEQGNFDEAIKGLNFVLSKEPQNMDAIELLGRIYLEQGIKDEATAIYEKLISIYLNEVKDNNLALEAYFDILKLSPDLVLPPRLQIMIAKLLEKEYQFIDAMQAYIQLIDKYPSSNETMVALIACGNICLNELNQPEKAIEMYEKGKELCGINPEWIDVIESGIKKAKANIEGL